VGRHERPRPVREYTFRLLRRAGSFHPLLGILATAEEASGVPRQRLNRWHDGGSPTMEEPRAAPRPAKLPCRSSRRSPVAGGGRSRSAMGGRSRRCGLLRGRADSYAPGLTGGNVGPFAPDGFGNMWVVSKTWPSSNERGAPLNGSPGTSSASSTMPPPPVAGSLAARLWIGFWPAAWVISRTAGSSFSYTAADGSAAVPHRLRSASRAGVGRDRRRVEAGFKAGASSRSTQEWPAVRSVHWSMEDEDRSVWLFTPCGLVRLAGRAGCMAERSDADDPGDRVRRFHGVAKMATNWQLWAARDQDRRRKLWFATREDHPDRSARLPHNDCRARAHRADHRDGKVYDAGSRALRLPARVRDLAIDYTA